MRSSGGLFGSAGKGSSGEAGPSTSLRSAQDDSLCRLCLLYPRGAHRGRRLGCRAAEEYGPLRAQLLTVAFAGLALLFLELDAQFAGFAQILVYIGAVAILVVFAILLTKGSETPKDGVFSHTWLAGLAVAAAVFLPSSGLGGASEPRRCSPKSAPTPLVTVQQIGQEALVGRYVLPLEIVAVLLTAATIGAADRCDAQRKRSWAAEDRHSE